MAQTFRAFMNRLAQMQGTAFDLWSEAQKAQAVSLLNEGFRWACTTDNPLFAFPPLVTSATVTVTNGLLSWAALGGDGTWFSLWTSDPRPAGSTACAVEAHVAQDGLYPVTEETSVFAFRRTAPYAGTYVAAPGAGSDYATPANIPDMLLDMVTHRALSTGFVAQSRWEAVNAFLKSYGEPGNLKDTMVSGLLNSGLVWQYHAIAAIPGGS